MRVVRVGDASQSLGRDVGVDLGGSGAGVAEEGLDRAKVEAIKQLVLTGLNSEHSRRAYGRALDDFLSWCDGQRGRGLNKAVIQEYKKKLDKEGLAASTINQRLSAVRKLATEAADNGLLGPWLAAGIAGVGGVPAEGRRTGNWLTREQAQALLDAPDTTTLKGQRDRALLAVLIGAGLRREEAANLTFAHVQQRDGRWARGRPWHGCGRSRSPGFLCRGRGCLHLSI